MPEQLTNLWNFVTGNSWILFALKIALAIAIGFAVQLGTVLLHALLTRELGRWLCGYLGVVLMIGTPIPAVFIGGWWWLLPPVAMLALALYTRVEYRQVGVPTTWIEVSGSLKWKRLGYPELKGPSDVAAVAEYLVHDETVKPGVQALAEGRLDEAHREFETLAMDGNAAAMNNLGVLLEAGLGVRASKADSAKWYRKAVEADMPLAKHNLAVLIAADHILGTSTNPHEKERDFVEAYALFSSAISQGLEISRRGLRNLRRHMSQEQISTTEKTRG